MNIVVNTVAYGNFHKYTLYQKNYFKKLFPQIEYRCFSDKDLLNLAASDQESKLISRSFVDNSFIWKPFLLSHIVSNDFNGDIKNIYIDITDTLVRLPKYIRLLDEISLFLYKPKRGNSIKQYTKYEDLCKFKIKIQSKVLNVTQLEAGLILFNNNSFSKNFFDTWFNYMANEFSTNIDPSIQLNGFIADRHDQSILSLIVEKQFRNNPNLRIVDLGNIHRSNVLNKIELQ